MELNGVFIQDTFAEAWKLEMVRLAITGISEDVALEGAHQFVGAAGSSELGARINGGIERMALPGEMPDGRPGVIVAVAMTSEKREALVDELALRVHLATLIPTCSVYDFMVDGVELGEKIDIYQCTAANWQGLETCCRRGGREVCTVPTTTGRFLYEKEFTVSVEGTDGHFVCYARSEASAVLAVKAAKKAVERVDGVCPMGYGLEQVYREHEYCPDLRDKVKESKVPDGVSSILNLLMFGASRNLMAQALREAVHAACQVAGVVQIGAMNFGGTFGPYKYYLRDAV
jgi:formylmethanofuran--tetrahydromethanopterin N-formyltransferase